MIFFLWTLVEKYFNRYFFLFLLVFLLGVFHCSNETIIEYVQAPISEEPAVNPNAPGSGDTGGPDSLKFWVKDRRKDAPNSLLAYTEITAAKLAYSENFVLYIESLQSNKMSVDEAQSLIDELQKKFPLLKEIYGNGHQPDIQSNNRIIILATDIKDDYADTSSYIAGYFAPRDLYSDDFTYSLFTDPEFMLNYSTQTILDLRGRSNENNMIYLDLSPFFNGVAFNNDKEKSFRMAIDTMFHEISHLLVYNYRVKVNKKANYETWMAEGTAELAPVLMGQTNMLKERLSQYAMPIMQAYFMEAPSLINWTDNALPHYLLSGLFFEYAQHRMNLQNKSFQFISGLIKEADLSISTIDNVFLQQTDSSFSSLYKDWVISQYLSTTGKRIHSITENSSTLNSSSNGFILRERELSYSTTPIQKKNSSGLAFLTGSFNTVNTNVTCLNPASYFNSYYTISDLANETDYTVNMNNGLQLIVAELLTNDFVNLKIYNSGDVIPFKTGSYLEDTNFHLMMYNSNFSGSCLSTGNLRIIEKNITKWIGENKTGWQTSPGALSDNSIGYFSRPAGIAMSYKNVHPSAKNYIYVSDYMQHSIIRWDVGSGTSATFSGRLGSEQTDCTNDSASDDGYKTTGTKNINNYCRRNLNSPHGIAIDLAENLYIADTSNHRIVKRDKDGNFIAWLGDTADDTWQTGIGKDFSPLASGRETKTNMFDSPWGIAIDEPNNYFYVSCYGTSRIVRRQLDTGAYRGFIGNGVEGWNTALATQDGHRSSERKYFKRPGGISIDDNYIYIADIENNRISRWTKITGKHEDSSANTTKIWLGQGETSWHNNTSTISGTAIKYMKLPFDVKAMGNYLYITDQRNNRLLKYNKDGTFIGFVGQGVTQWITSTENFQNDFTAIYSQYPSGFMSDPVFLLPTLKADTGYLHDYIFFSAIYNGRINRWNLDCLEDNSNAIACKPE